ncbi:MAG: MFS transporter [Candidatus Poribacteria bacterium]|nr:MFS transporter [Candidatus Poribacteria bacterium]
MRLKPIQLLTVYLPVLLIDFAFSSILTNTSFYTSYLGLSTTFLGTLMAVSTGCFAILAIPLGRLSDQIERRYILYTACLILGAVSIGLSLCRNGGHLMSVFPGIGISMALFFPAYEAWLAERESEGELIHRIMLFNLFWSIGMTLGPALSSYLYGDANPFIPFYLAGFFAVLTLLTVWTSRIAEPEPSKPSVHTDESESEPPEILYPPLSIRLTYLHLARCANFVSWFALGVLRQLAPKLTLEMGIRPATYGNLMLILGSVQTLAFVVLGTGYSTRWHYRFGPLFIVQLLAILSFLSIGLFQHLILWGFAFAVIGVTVAFTYFSSLYYGLDRHADKGNKSGWHEAILGVGILLGPFLGGISADSQLGVQSPYLLCAVAIGIAIFIEILILLKNSRHQADSR